MAGDAENPEFTSKVETKDKAETTSDNQNDTIKKRRTNCNQEDSVEPHNDDLEEEEDVGGRLEVRGLYANKGESDYTDFVPITVMIKNYASDDTTPSTQRTRKYNSTFAIIHYQQVVGRTVQSSAIHIQNPSFRNRLMDVFKDYPTVNNNASVLAFDAPYTPFVHCWESFLQVEAVTTEADQKTLFKSLRTILETELDDSLRAKAEFEKTWFIDFEHIMVPLVPGEVIVKTVDGVTEAGILQSASKTGRKFDSLRGQHIKNYNGVAVSARRGDKKHMQLSERIIIDAEAYYKFQFKHIWSLRSLDAPADPRVALNHERCEDDGRDSGRRGLTDEECLITVPRVNGFALETKEWCKFDLNSIHPMKWREQSFDNLVLDNKEKELLLAVAQRNREEHHGYQFDDFVQGKGKSLILLLCGPPGVGKTLTAESVFLVLLEYYDGVLILTTNRTDSLDPAFESRIDIALTYEDLTEDSRKDIWTNFLQKLPDGASKINARDLDVLSKWPLNGRQIKSAIKTACLLASKQKTALSLSHLDVVLDIRKKSSQLLRHPTEGDHKLPEDWRVRDIRALCYPQHIIRGLNSRATGLFRWVVSMVIRLFLFAVDFLKLFL
ncbi:hypothetical protein VPNG_02998 [Cytospora leucostoma]|uniref:ATPase AAA-type core domain-containing protein n=1 Tax=Cytospora leucostoma TaxID=1230097 RepID=A0A423XH26_9PEZI|nr:hypothetical protein VPNG_02998 [Cytospora leucostoma]